MPCGKKHNAMPSIPDPDSDSLTHSTPSSDIPSATPSSSPEDSLPAVGGGLSGAPPRWNGLAGWAMYFPGTSENDPACKGRAEVVSKVKHDLLNERFQQFLKLPANSTSVALDFQLLSQRSSPSALRSIAAALKKEPDFALASLGLAACRAAEDMLAQNAPDDSTMVAEVTHATKLCARIFNFSPFTALRLLKGTSVGTFVAVRGTVVRASTIRQQLVSMQFRCGRCGEDQTVDFADYKYTLPTACPTDKCRSRNFVPQRHTAITTDWQRIRIQEQQQRDQDDTGGAGVEEGRIPRTIDAELFGELIDSCLPGDVATVCGVVKVMAITEGGGGGGGPQSRGAAQSLYYMYIEANSVCTMRSRAGAAASSADTPEAATVHTVIHEVVREDDPFGFLVHSAVPSIYGHELVKAGMLLALFGGAPKLYKSNADSGGGGTAGNGNSHSGGGTSSSSSDQVSIRRDAHVLVVGDPGLGKSQMLKAFCNIAPRGVYICGNTSSTAGLTVTVVRDATGDFALEAGALVLGDGGVCCIDEFDKMGSEHGALLEAMEQQSVSVAKAGLLCNLSARTTVLAAANPVGGHYDRAKTVCENLKIALPLLSRFDFVFILMDKADMERDRFISEHVMRSFGRRSRARRRNNNATLQQPAVAWRGAARAGLHGDAAGAAAAATAATQAVAVARDAGTKSYGRLGGILTSGGGTDKDGYEEGEEEQNGLERRLQRMRVKDPLPPSLFREYVSYARTHVHPKLSTGAKSVLQDFYLELRRAAKEQAADTTPVTTRQLESMIRLSEARARAVMRTIVTAEDARDVVEIMRKCMVTELTDDTGVVDFGRASGMSRSSESRKFIAALDAEAKRKQSGSFSDADLRRVATAIGINGSRFNTIVESVNNQGFIIKKGRGNWLLSTM